jgi:leucyl aminopeptidase
MSVVQVHGGIEKMKMDMAGGAAVLGAAEALSQIRPEGIEVTQLLTQP